MARDKDGDVTARLRELLVDAGVPEEDARRSPPGRDLHKAGLLDSIGVIGLALRVEKEFGVRLRLGAMDPENFNTLRGLARLVEKERARAERR
jgi:acyl carrier protein